MGTRNLTIVVADKATRVCQYGQWDGYPEGAGCTVLEFLHKHATDLATFREKVLKIPALSDEELRAVDQDCERQKAELKTLYPHLTRDTGAGILEMIMEDKVPGLQLDLDFVNESLFCEWAYLIDLDTRVFEVYEGFQKAPHTQGRFASGPCVKPGYYPIALTASWPLDALPTEEEFLAKWAEPEEAAETQSSS